MHRQKACTDTSQPRLGMIHTRIRIQFDFFVGNVVLLGSALLRKEMNYVFAFSTKKIIFSSITFERHIQ
jgi:hypothetical protein